MDDDMPLAEPIDWEYRSLDDVKSSYDRFKKSCMAVRIIGSAVIFPDEPDSRAHFQCMPMKDFNFIFGNKETTMAVTRGINRVQEAVSFAKRWQSDETRVEYENIGVYLPGEVPPGHFNLWRGYGVKPKKGKWPTLKGYFFTDLCREDTTDFNYWLYLLAYRVQYYDRRPEIGVQIIGRQGSGKTTLEELFSRLLGIKFVYKYNDPAQLESRFNPNAEYKLVNVYDEATYGKASKTRNKVKGLITSSYIDIEKKSINAYPAKNLALSIFLSNSDIAVGLDLDDRRQFVLKASNEHVGPEHKEYWDNVYAAIHNGEVAALLYDLLHMKIDARMPMPPKNAAREEVANNSASHEQEFVKQLLHSGVLPVGPLERIEDWPQPLFDERRAVKENPWPTGPTVISWDVMFLAFMTWMRERGQRDDRLRIADLKAAFTSMLGDSAIVHTKNDGRYCKPNVVPRKWVKDDNGGRWCVVKGGLPKKRFIIAGLLECRNQYCKTVGREEHWEVEYDENGDRIISGDEYETVEHMAEGYENDPPF